MAHKVHAMRHKVNKHALLPLSLLLSGMLGNVTFCSSRSCKLSYARGHAVWALAALALESARAFVDCNLLNEFHGVDHTDFISSFDTHELSRTSPDAENSVS